MRKIFATIVMIVAVSLTPLIASTTTADAAPTMTKAQLTSYKKKHSKEIRQAAWRAYKKYFAPNNGCRADFEYAYRGVKVRTSKTPPEWRSAVVNGPLSRDKVGKVYVLKKLRPYAGHCS